MVDFKKKIPYDRNMKIRSYFLHQKFIGSSLVCICSFIFSYSSFFAATPSSPRKPIISNPSATRAAPKPLPYSNTETLKNTANPDADATKNSSQVKILTIIRSHKVPSAPSSVIPVQNGAATISHQVRDTSVRSGSGTQAQVLKIIERK